MDFDPQALNSEDEAQPAITIRRQEMLDNLKCPVCMELIFSEVKMCRNNHPLCSICLEKVSQCPICKEPSSTFLRNRFAEEFVQKYIVRCENHPFDCRRHEFLENKDLLETHQESCKFRKIQCWIPNCEAQVLFKLLDTHWEQYHGITDTDSEEISFEIVIDPSVIPAYRTETFHLKHSSHSFIVIFEALIATREVTVYTYGYCPKDLLPSYQASATLEVTVNDPSGTKTNTHQWNGPVREETARPSSIVGERRDFHVFLPEYPEPTSFQKMHCRLNVKIISTAPPGEFTRKLSIPV